MLQEEGRSSLPKAVSSLSNLTLQVVDTREIGMFLKSFASSCSQGYSQPGVHGDLPSAGTIIPAAHRFIAIVECLTTSAVRQLGIKVQMTPERQLSV